MYSVNLGPLAFPVAPLLLAICVALGLIVAALVAKKQRQSATDPLLTILLGSFLVGRLVFVLRYADSYSSVWQMLDFRDRGFDLTALLVTALLLLGWQLKRKPLLRPALLAGAATSAGLFLAISLFLHHARLQATLPDIYVQQLDGQAVALQRVAEGKPLVVNLWASWCPPCRREMPVLQQAERDNPQVGFILLNQREHPETVQQFLQQAGLEFQHPLLDRDGALSSKIGAHGLPVTLYFAADGSLVHSHMGELSAASLQQSLQLLKP